MTIDIIGMDRENGHIRGITELRDFARLMYEEVRALPRQGAEVRRREILAKLLPCVLDDCAIGDGDRYEELVLSALLLIFGDLVDQENQGTQVEIGGGFADIELYFCDEMLVRIPYWSIWRTEYGIRSILVEVKNEKKKSQHKHVCQLKNYLELHKRGRFGLLVSRSGFSRNAFNTFKEYNESKENKNDYLLLPITHEDLKYLLSLSLEEDKAFKVMQELRIIENRLSR